MITIFRSDSAIVVVVKGRARDVGIGFDFLFESQSAPDPTLRIRRFVIDRGSTSRT
jgi:hypothetical protein